MENKSNSAFKQVQDDVKSTIDNLSNEEGKTFTDTLRNVVFVGIILAILSFVGMIMMQVIAGVVAIVVSVVFGFAMLIGVKYMRNFDSVIAQKIHNWTLQSKITEARKNSVIQLKNILLTKKHEVQDALTERAELVGNLKQLENELRNTDPTKDRYYSRKKEMFDSLSKASTKNDEVIRRMKEANEDFENEINMYESMEKFAATASKLAKAFDKAAITDMLSLEAFNAIEERYCVAMAELETQTEFA